MHLKERMMHIKNVVVFTYVFFGLVLTACGSTPLICLASCEATETSRPLITEMREAEATQELAVGVYSVSYDSEIDNRVPINGPLLKAFFEVSVVRVGLDDMYRICLIEYDIPESGNCQDMDFLGEQMEFTFISIRDELIVEASFNRVATQDTWITQNWLITYTISESNQYQWGDELDLQHK